jgi:hypothetical protein
MFSSFLNNSIHSFQELVEAFINQYQVHMAPKLSLANLMRCKKPDLENINDIISWYQLIYSQINVKTPDPYLQNIFIDNLQTKI